MQHLAKKRWLRWGKIKSQVKEGGDDGSVRRWAGMNVQRTLQKIEPPAKYERLGPHRPPSLDRQQDHVMRYLDQNARLAAGHILRVRVTVR